MIRQATIVVLLAVLLGATGELHAAFVSDADRTEYQAACAYYDARARGARKHDPREFVAFLGDVCAAAQASLEEGSDDQKARAADLLRRIVELRRTIDQMNAERSALTAPLLSRVTPSGEFLIAHRMGLMNAFDAWLDSGAEFSLASYP